MKALNEIMTTHRSNAPETHADIFTAVIWSYACTQFTVACTWNHVCHILSFLYNVEWLFLPPCCAQVTDDYTVIGRSLFKKETNLQLFVGLKVTLSTGESGVIEGGFGQSGKFKIRIPGKDLQSHLSQVKKRVKWGPHVTLFGLSRILFSLILHKPPASSTHTFRPFSLAILEFWGSADTFQDVVRAAGLTSRATFPRFLWGLPVFRGKSDQCLFYLLLLKTHNSTPGGKRK